MRDVDIARWRLRSQYLVAPHAGSARDVVGSLVAVQAENAGQAGWAVAARTRNPDPADLAKLLDDGVVLRTHVLRPTWHFVRAEDIGWLIDLTGPRVRKVTGPQLRTVHGLDGRGVDRAIETVLRALADRGQLTRAELATELRDCGVPVTGHLVMILLAHCRVGGPDLQWQCGRRRAHLRAAGPTRSAPATARAHRGPRRARVALLHRARPGDERDLAYWATLAVTDVRAVRPAALPGPDAGTTRRARTGRHPVRRLSAPRPPSYPRMSDHRSSTSPNDVPLDDRATSGWCPSGGGGT